MSPHTPLLYRPCCQNTINHNEIHHCCMQQETLQPVTVMYITVPITYLAVKTIITIYTLTDMFTNDYFGLIKKLDCTRYTTLSTLQLNNCNSMTMAS